MSSVGVCKVCGADSIQLCTANNCRCLGENEGNPWCATCHDQGEVWTGETAYQGHWDPPEPIMEGCPECSGETDAYRLAVLEERLGG